MLTRRITIILAGSAGYIVALTAATTVVVSIIAVDPLASDVISAWLRNLRELLGDENWLFSAAVFSTIVAATHAVFLLPVFRFRPPAGERGKSLKLSIILAGLVAAGLAVALAAAVGELGASIITGVWRDSPWPRGADMLDQMLAPLLLLVVFLLSWFAWGFILLIFTREMWADRLIGRLVNVLLAGTMIEFVVILPIDIIVRRRTDCYCATGTFWSLCLASTALLWLAGPAAWLAINSRRHRAVRERYCDRCGHARGPTPGDCCPECGHAWNHARC